MSFTDQVLGALSQYGVPALFVILMIASAGVPLPVTLVLILSGSLIDQGELSLLPVLVAASAGAVAGDQIGYLIGRWGGRRLNARLAKLAGGEEQLQRAEATTRKYGGAGVFFSRWLLTPLGPPLNLTSGIAQYSWPKFLLWDTAGEILWVVLYVSLGRIFSDQVEQVASALGNATWLILGLLVTLVLGWKLLGHVRDKAEDKADGVAVRAKVGVGD